MAQDYKRKPQQRHKSSFPGRLIKGIAIFLCGYLAGGVFDIKNLSDWLNTHVFNHKEPVVSTAKALEKPAPVKPKFEFYTLLSKDAPEPAPIALKPPAKTASVSVASQMTANSGVTQASHLVKPVTASTVKESWQIQVASFNKRQDADNLKASLVLRGFDVMITPVAQGGITWFRVLIGPFETRSEADKSSMLLAKNVHVKGIVRKSSLD